MRKVLAIILALILILSFFGKIVGFIISVLVLCLFGKGYVDIMKDTYRRLNRIFN